MHESLMDVGRVFCQARKRDCLQCPLKKGCRPFAIQKDLFQDAKPPKSASAKKNQEQIVELARIVCIKNKKILLVQRETGQWLSGQWEVPTFVIKGIVPDNQYPPITFQLEKTAKKISSTITKYQFQNHIILQKSLPSKIALKKFYKWIEISQLAQLPLTSITHKIEKEIKSFLKNQEAHKPDSVL